MNSLRRFSFSRQRLDRAFLHETQDEKVYRVLSRCMKDRYDIFGSLPDTIEDDWIETEEKLEEMMDQYFHLCAARMRLGIPQDSGILGAAAIDLRRVGW